MLNGIQNFLQIINDNWTTMLVIIGLCFTLINKIKDLISKSDKEKIEIVKHQIRETMLKMITDAEIDFKSWNQAGSIKRSQVIKEIYEEYPILSKVIDQNEFIKWIDVEINTSLQTLKDIININDVNT